MSLTIQLTESNFEQTLKESKNPVLVDFWAEWCGPCKAIAPILEEVAVELEQTVTIAKLNVDQNPTIAPKFGIRGIPALFLFKDGEVIAKQIGAVTKSQLKEFINSHI